MAAAMEAACHLHVFRLGPDGSRSMQEIRTLIGESTSVIPVAYTTARA
jgi:hypothetical protein